MVVGALSILISPRFVKVSALNVRNHLLVFTEPAPYPAIAACNVQTARGNGNAQLGSLRERGIAQKGEPMKYSVLPKHAFLYCRGCGERYSATRGDYFHMLDRDSKCGYCGEPLIIAVERREIIELTEPAPGGDGMGI